MARNHEKYAYTELAIPRNSAWYPLLVAEAEAKGMPLAQVALERLASTYLVRSHLAESSIARQLVPRSAELKPPFVGSAAEIELEDDAEIELNEERAAHNAAAFLDNNGGGFF